MYVLFFSYVLQHILQIVTVTVAYSLTVYAVLVLSTRALLRYKCTKHQFIHLLTTTFKDLHIENSKNYKR